jgi:membrane fusion protein (multidrug efflux system)
MATRNVLIVVLAATTIGSLGWNLYRSTHEDDPAANGPGRSPVARAAGASSPAGGGAGTPVRLGIVANDTLTSSVEAVGTVKANEAVDITAVAAGLVTRIAFRDGGFVRPGDTIVELDPTQARAALEEAEAARAQSRSDFERGTKLQTTHSLSESQLQQLASNLRRDEARADAAAGRLADTVIRAPFAGRLGLRRVSLGSLVSPGSMITTLDDTRSVKVDFAVPESAFPALRVDLAVSGTTVAYPGRVFKGAVASIDTRVDPVNRSALVRAQFDNADGSLAPGMYLTLRLASNPRATITVPERALLSDQGKQFVFIVADGVASRREVQLGERLPGKVEVLQGLALGDSIVIDGAIKLREGARITELGGS